MSRLSQCLSQLAKFRQIGSWAFTPFLPFKMVKGVKQYSDNQKLMNKSHERGMVELEKENVILCKKVYSMRLFIGNIKVHFAKFVNLIQESTTTMEVIRVAIKELMNIISIPLSNMESS